MNKGLMQSLNKSKSHDDCTYITPKWLTDLLGPFDVDIAAAKDSYNMIGRRANYYGPTGSLNCGLAAKLNGSDFVWCNPPFAMRHGARDFVRKISLGTGIMLVGFGRIARTRISRLTAQNVRGAAFTITSLEVPK